MSEFTIKVDRLTKRFGPVTAVDDISLAVPRATVAGLLGGNGAGKTSTLAMLLGLLLPTSGSITVLGNDMIRWRYGALDRMNFSSPYIELPQRLTVRENLTVYGHLYGVTGLAAWIRELTERLDIAGFLDRPCGRLSAGQKTRVALAKALLNRPEVLLLDEPTASLDPDTGDWVRTYLETYQAETGATILLASHNMAEVERLCSMVFMMRKGRIVDRGTAPALLSRYGRASLEEVFLDVARGRGRGRGAEAGP